MINQHHYKRYLKFIDNIRNDSIDRTILSTEKHHIIPHSHGGSNDPKNIITLTLREHYLAHWMLMNSYPNCEKMSFAFIAMNSRYKTKHIIGGKAYTKAKLNRSKQISKLQKDPNSNMVCISKLSTYRQNDGRMRCYHISNPDKTFYEDVKIIKNNPNLKTWNSGKVIVYDTLHPNTKAFQVSKHHPLYKSGRYINVGRKKGLEQTGKNNPNHKGTYITPYGNFNSLSEAVKNTGLSMDSIRLRCKKPHTILTIHSTKKLENKPHHLIGKTWGSLGWGFIPV